MNEDYLPLAYLNAWEYCPRRFYLEYVLGEMADNEHIIFISFPVSDWECYHRGSASAFIK
jgi:hypothetical protein